VRDANGALEAMRRIAQQPRARFVSRGDSSGTHERESELWRACDARPAGDRLVIAGQGMSGTLRVADEIGGYTLADRATMAQLAPAVTHFQILFERDPALINTYAVITSGKASPAARRFADWLARGDGRARIDAFRVRGARAFFVWPEGQAATTPGALPSP
jgi:tungstate transport system substrate-binding protein